MKYKLGENDLNDNFLNEFPWVVVRSFSDSGYVLN